MHMVQVNCLFVLSFSFHSRIFTHMKTSPLPVEACKFGPMPGTHRRWQLGFFSVAPLLRHGASVYNGYLRWPVTLTPIAECLAVKLSLHVLTILVCCGWDSNTQPSACEANALHRQNLLHVNFTWIAREFHVNCTWIEQ